MKQSLQLRLGQQLTMTPQLQQAIKLLQLSSLDLQQEIQEALDSNVMLEIDESNSTDSNGASEAENEKIPQELDNAVNDTNEPEPSLTGDDFSNEASADRVDFENAQNEIPDELSTDSSWEDVYDTPVDYTQRVSEVQGAASSWSGDDSNLFENNGKTEDSLKEHLLWQMEMTPFSDTDRLIADSIIDAIDDSGYLTQSLEDLLESFPPE